VGSVEALRRSVVFSLKALRQHADAEKAFAKLLTDSDPSVRFYAIVADGVEKHPEEMKALAEADDPEIAEQARERIKRNVPQAR